MVLTSIHESRVAKHVDLPDAPIRLGFFRALTHGKGVERLYAYPTQGPLQRAHQIWGTAYHGGGEPAGKLRQPCGGGFDFLPRGEVVKRQQPHQVRAVGVIFDSSQDLFLGGGVLGEVYYLTVNACGHFLSPLFTRRVIPAKSI